VELRVFAGRVYIDRLPGFLLLDPPANTEGKGVMLWLKPARGNKETRKTLLFNQRDNNLLYNSLFRNIGVKYSEKENI